MKNDTCVIVDNKFIDWCPNCDGVRNQINLESFNRRTGDKLHVCVCDGSKKIENTQKTE